MKIKRSVKDDVVFDFGDVGDDFYIIMDGSVSVQTPQDINHVVKPIIPNPFSKKIIKGILDKLEEGKENSNKKIGSMIFPLSDFSGNKDRRASINNTIGAQTQMSCTCDLKTQETHS